MCADSTAQKDKSKGKNYPKENINSSRSFRSIVEQPSEATEEEQYEVQAIVDDKIEPDGQHLYKVRWKGYPADTWQPEANLTQAPDPSNSSRKRFFMSASRGAKRRKRR